MMEHTYDYLGRTNALFYVNLPSDMPSDKLVSESVVSLDLIRYGEILMRCRNPYMSNKCFRDQKGLTRLTMGLVSYESDCVCGEYKEPFIITVLKRNGDVANVQIYHNPVFRLVSDAYDKESDFVYLITYASREVKCRDTN